VAGARVTPASVRIVAPEPVRAARGTGPRVPSNLPDSLAEVLAATTDAEGNAELKGCRPDDIESVRIDAAGFGLQQCDLGAGAQGASPVTLKAAGRLVGRVQGTDPSAGRGLLIRAFARGQRRGEAFGAGRATTDADGRFEIPALASGELVIGVPLPAGTKLRARVPASLRIEPGKTTEITIPLEGPPSERTVAGQVVDRAGRPVAGATVFQSGDSAARTETETGAEGRFSLSGVVARPTFLFVRKPRYRFGGIAIGAALDNVTLTIHRVQEPPRVVRKTLVPALPRQEEIALARRLLDPYAAQVLKDGDEHEKVRTLEALARIEPERVLEVIQQKKVFKNAWFSGMIGSRVATGLMDESVDEAVAVLEALEDPGAKALGMIEATHKLESQDRSRAIEVLDRALLHARAAKEPGGINLLLMGQVAERFLDLGQAERGRTILREGEALAKQLPNAGWVGYARGAFAEELAQIDLDAALALTKDLADAREFDRHHGNIAHEIAGRDPAQAERVLAMVKDSLQRDQYTVRVVYRMAPLDLARARRLAESIADEWLKGYALGMMALRLAETGKDSAREVLESACEALGHPSPVGPASARGLYYASSTAAVLLPVAERIDPGLVDEYLWRCLAMRLPKPWRANPDGQLAQSDVLLAMMLARYDRAIAESLIEPFAPRSGPAQVTLSNRGDLYAAAAAIDPKWAVALIEAIPDDPDLKPNSSKNSARMAVATLLGRAGEQRFRKLQDYYLHLWLPDTEDIGSND
jgi:hypothetical protein